MVAPGTGTAAVVIDPAPSATSPTLVAIAPVPMATPVFDDTKLLRPIDTTSVTAVAAPAPLMMTESVAFDIPEVDIPVPAVEVVLTMNDRLSPE